MAKHIHAECIIAMANGEKEFEIFSDSNNNWFTAKFPPLFREDVQYRIKPKTTLRHFAWIPAGEAWEEVAPNDANTYAIVVTLHIHAGHTHPFSVSILENNPLELTANVNT